MNWLNRSRRSWTIGCVVAVLIMVFGAQSHAASVFYVDKTATGDDSGDEWADACPTLQDALALAHDPLNPSTRPYFFLVAQGVYAPDEFSTGETDDPSDTFLLLGGDQIQGGFAGLAGGDPDAHDPVLYETILTGLVDTGVHSEHVVTVTHGGAAIADTILRDCTITEGDSPAEGGGIWIASASDSSNQVQITNCTVTGNAATTHGGGIACGPSVAPQWTEIRNSRIIDNTAGDSGGGIALLGGAQILNCEIRDNTSTEHGGGVSVQEGIEVYMINCQVTGNTSDDGNGGGLHAFGDDPEESVIYLTNCLFAGNSAEDSSNGLGGGIYTDDIKILMWGATVADNTARRGGGLRHGGGVTLDPSFINTSIFWNNLSNQSFGHEILLVTAPLTIEYCDVKDRNNTSSVSSSVTQGSGNIGENTSTHDPDFVNPGAGNYKLSCSSPCINTGDPDADTDFPPDDFDVDEDSDTSEEIVDLTLGHRILGVAASEVIDMGAYESHGTPSCPMDSNGDGEIDIDDLLAVINFWGQPGLADVAPGCSGDGTTNIDDLLLLINNWGPCGEPVSLPESISECMSWATGECEESEDPDCWNKAFEGCLMYLCEEEIIECD